MLDPLVNQGAIERGWKDFEQWVTGLWFWLFEVTAGGAVAGIWGWQNGMLAVVAGAVLALIAAIFIAPLRQRNELRREVKRLRVEFESYRRKIEEASPLLLFVDIYQERKELALHTPSGTELGWGAPEFWHILIINDPEVRNDRATARMVVGHLRFEQSGKTIHAMVVRWSLADSPIQFGSRMREHYGIDIFPDGVVRHLDLCFRYPGDDECYWHNNDSVLTGDWKDKDRLIPPGTYDLTLELKGQNVKTEMRFTFTNPGRNKPISLARR